MASRTFRQINVLDKGYVRLLDVMGSDKDIASGIAQRLSIRRADGVVATREKAWIV